MPAKDIYHDLVKNALILEKWMITNENMRITFGGKKAFIDLGAEKILSAEKDNVKIAVEIKSFLRESIMSDLHTALGQYNVYKSILKRIMVDRTLFLAIPDDVFEELFSTTIGDAIREDYEVNLLVFNINNGEIVKWLPEPF